MSLDVKYVDKMSVDEKSVVEIIRQNNLRPLMAKACILQIFTKFVV